MDIEDIVENACDAECLLAETVEGALRHIETGVDFAMLDINLGRGREDSLPVALRLLARHIPFCFVSASLASLPDAFAEVPRVGKPFGQHEIVRMLPSAA